MMSSLEVLRTRVRRLSADDRGTSLAELLVGMALMSIFMSIFLTAILLMTKTANKVEATSISTSQTNQAYLRLDKSIRYATAVSTPGTSTTSGDWYVEFDSPVAAGSSGDACTQLRVDSNQLQQRTWTVVGGTSSAASAWLPIANNVSNGTAVAGSTDAPFTLLAGTGTASTAFQRLQLTLVTTAGASGATTSNRAQITFTALNSDVTLAANATTCQQWGRP